MSYSVCSVPVSPMRKEPSHRSEMVSQLVFGEHAEVVEHGVGEWVRVRCGYDGYAGWCQANQVLELEPPVVPENGPLLTAGRLDAILLDGVPMWVPLGSSWTGSAPGELSWGTHTLVFNGKLWNPLQANRDPGNIRELASFFLNTPYLWGGKTILGTDCSGFTQTIYKFLQVPLLRDAHQQAEQGRLISNVSDACFGDLAFFENEVGRIVHVGIILDANEIIHASGKVRIDSFTNSAIINRETMKKTHQLAVIRRFF